MSLKLSQNSSRCLMETREDAVIQRLLGAGYCDPRKDTYHSRSLRFTSLDGKVYRKFATEFVYLEPTKVKKSQVRDAEYDKTYCKEQLKPLIEAQGLKFVPHINEYKYLETGHNRFPVMMELHPGKKLPFLVISRPYLRNDDGTYILSEDTAFEDEIAKISSNGAPPNNPYNMKSVAVQVRRLFDIDPTFRGLNPTGEWFQQNAGPFDQIMDKLHEHQFKAKGTRTKIRQEAGRGQSIVIPIEFSHWTHAATSIGWSPGVKKGAKTPSRMSFVEWVDPSDNTNITTVSTNGNKLNEKVSLELFDMYLTNTIESTSGVKLLMKVNSPSANPLALNKQRREFISSKVDALNFKLRSRSFPEIRECFWVQQLNHPSDKGLHFVQNSQGVLKEK